MTGRFTYTCGPVRHRSAGKRTEGAYWWLHCSACEHLTLVSQDQVTGLIPIMCDCGHQDTVAVLTETEAEIQAERLAVANRGRTPHWAKETR